MTAPSEGQYVNAGSADPLSIDATASDAGSGIDSVTFAQCSDTSTDCSTGVWSSLGSSTSAPYSVSWTLPADGNRALRVVATDTVGRTTTVVRNVVVDRTAPAAALADPGANLSGTVALSATATDTGGTGVNSVSFQYSPAGEGIWTTISTDSSAPYTASLDTTGLGDDLYDLRVFVTDVAGNTQTAEVASRRVDNTPPTVTMDDPGTNVRGTVALTSNAERLRLRRRHRHLPVLAGRPGRLALDLGALGHDRAHGRPLRPAGDRDRQRRQLGRLRRGHERARRQHRPEP